MVVTCCDCSVIPDQNMPRPEKEELNIDTENQALLTLPITDTTSQISNDGGAERSFRLLNEAKHAADLLKKGGKARMSEKNLMSGFQHSQKGSFYGKNDNSDDVPEYIDTSPMGHGDSNSEFSKMGDFSLNALCSELLTQVPAIIIGTILGIVVGIPFAAAYFPISWSGTDNGDTSFPLPGKEIFGLRMFIFSTVMCQVVLTFTSSFVNPIGLQIVENIPFFHSIAFICIEELGYGEESLSNLLLILALTSILVGISFYILGAFGLGRAVYFIPKHVLVGLIGGIGVFIVCVAVQVTINEDFTLSMAGVNALLDNFHLFSPVLAFEVVLRLLILLTTDRDTGKAQFSLLAPVFFVMIPPIFFMGLRIFHLSFDEAQNDGYFFPIVEGSSNNMNNDIWAEMYAMITDPHLLDMWRVLDINHLSMKVLLKSFPTVIGMTLFSLIHVPIYVPALSMTTGQDVDINGELIAHGYSNMITGLMGGLQNYMAYSNSVAYARSGGKGKVASLGVAACTSLFFFIGPAICIYIPRCMAGVILLHLGLDLVLEALVDAYPDFERLEYFGIWFVTGVIGFLGMEKGLLAGVISALTVFIAQSVNVQHPINGYSSAELLRSSKWNRSAAALQILDDSEIGCSRICIIQLQGHLFFGNLSKLTEAISDIIQEHEMNHQKPWILVLDFSLVLGMDGSAAMGMTKIKDMIHGDYDIALCIYVTGEERNKRFPCEYKLADDLIKDQIYDTFDSSRHTLDQAVLHNMYASIEMLLHERKTIPADQICETLDEALKFAEDVIIARIDKSLCDMELTQRDLRLEGLNESDVLEEEVTILETILENLLPKDFHNYFLPVISNLEREIYYENDIIWKSGSAGTSTKFVVRGIVVGIQDEDKNIFEEVEAGQVIGESAFVQNLKRTSTVRCRTSFAVMYSMSRESYERLLNTSPKIAMCIQMIAVRNLASRAQHISHNVFCRQGRNLPI